MVASELGQRPRRWVRRHPWATTLLVLVFLFFAFSLATADDATASDRFEIAVGLAILYLPLLAVTLLIAWLIDRRDRQRAPRSVPAPTAGFAAAPVELSPAGELPIPDAAVEMTARVPDPRISSAQAEPFRRVARDDLLAMSQAAFEDVCARALGSLGFGRVERTGAADDTGVGITAVDAQGRSVVVMCMRSEPGLGIASSVVQDFVGTMASPEAVDRGVIMTTTEFTRSAIDLAARHDVVLIDGDDLVKILNLLGET